MKYVCIACLLWVMKNTHAQTTEAAISETLYTFFHAMKKADTALLRKQFAPGAMMQTVVQLPDGTTTVRNQSVTAFLESIARLAEGDADERITIHTLRTDGVMASVWTPYTFYFKGKLSHCGVNAFQLVKMNNSWKIQYVIDTRRKQECNAD